MGEKNRESGYGLSEEWLSVIGYRLSVCLAVSVIGDCQFRGRLEGWKIKGSIRSVNC